MAQYGDRFLSGYERRSLLGRGGCAVVWLAKARDCMVAVKQVVKGNTVKHRTDLEAVRREIAVADLFFRDGQPRVSPQSFPGVMNICQTFEYEETKQDVWLVMEFGGESLSKAVFDVRGEFHRGARIYRVHHQDFFEDMREDPAALQELLRQVLRALDLLYRHGVCHADIKPDNIMVRQDGNGRFHASLIDFGSAFAFDCADQLGMATPEYMAPEALEFVTAERVKRTMDIDPAGLDIWSLGCIFLELIVGLPLWLSYKARVVTPDNRSVMGVGLFAVNGRDPWKIRNKQLDVVQKLGRVISTAPGLGLENPMGIDLLRRMLAWHPEERITPAEALEHPYLADAYEPLRAEPPRSVRSTATTRREDAFESARGVLIPRA